MKNCIKEHFNLGKLSPVHENPQIFIASQWQQDKAQPNIKYLIYRTIHATFLLTTWILSLWGPWYIFLTNWGYTISTLQSMICWIMLVVDVIARAASRESCSRNCVLKFHSVYWILHAMCNCSGFLITIVYWSAIYGPAGNEFTAQNFFVHGSNSMLIFLDLLVTAHPVHLVHFLYPFLFGSAYIVFSIAYYFYDKNRGGTGKVYEFLDYNKPAQTTGVLIGIFIFLLILHCFTYGMYKLRQIIHRKITKDSSHSMEELF